MNLSKVIMVVVAACFLSAGASAQVVVRITQGEGELKREPIDDVLITVEYEMSYVADTSKRDKPEKEMMMLKIGRRTSSFYSYARFVADSVMKALQASGASMETMGEQMQQYQSRISYQIYKNHPQGKVTTLDELAAGRYRCEEANEAPQWELTDETATILSYPCRKATCSFKGRDYEAWFTTDIPRSEGPWKLQGLPGLILRAQDARREYAFECVALVQEKGDAKIMYGDKGYEPVSRKDLNRLFERFAADPIGYIQSTSPNVNVHFRNEAGESIRPKNTPYNPIELEQ